MEDAQSGVVQRYEWIKNKLEGVSLTYRRTGSEVETTDGKRVPESLTVYETGNFWKKYINIAEISLLKPDGLEFKVSEDSPYASLVRQIEKQYALEFNKEKQ